jgi:hypothetical protein
MRGACNRSLKYRPLRGNFLRVGGGAHHSSRGLSDHAAALSSDRNCVTTFNVSSGKGRCRPSLRIRAIAAVTVRLMSG